MRSLIAVSAFALLLFASPCLAQGTAYFWAGGEFDGEEWIDTIIVDANEWANIPIYFMGDPNVWINDMCYALGARYDLIDQFDADASSSDYWPFNTGEHGWSTHDFVNYNDDVLDPGEMMANPAGYHSLSFVGFCRNVYTDPDWLHSEVPIHILDFRVHVIDNSAYAGWTFCNALQDGRDPLGGPSNVGDTLAGPGYPQVNYYACVKFSGTAQFGSLSGVVTDMYGAPLENVHITVENNTTGYLADDFTEGDGSYIFADFPYGDCIITFAKTGYIEMRQEYLLNHAVNVLDMTLYEPAAEEVVLWAGPLDGSPVEAPINCNIDIPIYFQGQTHVWGGDICYNLGTNMELLDAFNIEACQYFRPFNTGENGWSTKSFGGYNDDVEDGGNVNPPGYHSLEFIGFCRTVYQDPDWLYSEIPIHILSFNVHAADNEDLIGTVHCDALIQGVHSHPGHFLNVGDTVGGPGYSVSDYYSCVEFAEAGYPYVPGDVNMYHGDWPPVARGSDVTFLVNYFRGMPTSPPCLLDGFWASADANGDCQIIGSDATKFINYYRGLTTLQYCPDYPTLWPTQDDVPDIPPGGWPPCE